MRPHSAPPADPRPLVARPLSAAAFAPYGQVLHPGAPLRVNDGLAVRRDTALDLACTDPGARLCLSVFDVDVRPAPLLVSTLERHPHSAQAFLPLSDCTALVVVAGALADGGLDEDSLAAFHAPQDAGLCYAPGIWHLGLTSLDRPGRFQMATWAGGMPDTETTTLARPLLVLLPERD